MLPGSTYKLAGIYSFGRGLIDRGQLSGENTKYNHLHRLSGGQIVLSKLKAWEGAVAVVSEQFAGTYASSEYPTFTLDESLMLPPFMQLICESPWFWHEIMRRCRGTAERRARIHPNEFLFVPVPLPSVGKQWEIVQRVEDVRYALQSVEQRLKMSTHLKRRLWSLLTSTVA